MTSRHHDDEIEIQACEWWARVRDGEYDPDDPIQDPAARFEAFLRWSSQSPRHLRAARTAIHVSHELQRIDSEHAIDEFDLLTRRPDNVIQLLSRDELPRRVSPARRPRGSWMLCASLVLMLLVPLGLDGVAAWPAHYDAGIGQRIFVPLEDRSTIELNTRTRLEVAYGPRSREITLLSGEAIFDVHHDPSRPFRVISGDTVIEDVGTKFAVYRHPDGTTTVTVLEGRVSVTTRAGLTKTLQYGEVATAVTHSHLSTLRVELLSLQEIKRRLSWETGELSFEGQTLSEAITELNRYNVRQVVIEDPALAGRQIGGVFQPIDLDGFLTTLQRVYELRAVASPTDANVIELKRGQEGQ